MKDEFKPVKPEKFKKYKKGQLGSWQKFNNKTDAGNVELNTQIFNNASTPQASPNTSPVGGGMCEDVDDKDKYGVLWKDFITTLKTTPDEKLFGDNIKLVDNIPEGPSFVLPNGKIVDAEDAFEYGDEMTHQRILGYLSIYDDWSKDKDEDIDTVAKHLFGDFDAYEQLDEVVYDNVMFDRGWVRLNTGTEGVDGRYYLVLPKKRPTNAQLNVVEKFIENAETWLHLFDILIYVDDSKYHPTSKIYSFDDYTTEDIIKNIKRYYASGVLYETVEPQEQLFTDEDIKYLTEWIIDVIDLNVKKTETELGDGRYIVYTERERDGGHVFDVIDGLNSVYIGYDTTFGEVEPIVSVMERVANSIAKNIITMIQEYDNSIIGDSTIRQIKEKCMKSIDKGIDDVLILEQVGGYDAIACEFDKKKNSLRVYSIENPTIDLYRGKLK